METAYDLPKLFSRINNRLVTFYDELQLDEDQLRCKQFHEVSDDVGLQHRRVQIGRFLKKFEVPDENRREAVKASTLKRWKEVDERLSAFSTSYLYRLAFRDIRVIRMKRLLHNWLGDFEWRIEDAWVGPGTNIGADPEHTSAYHKLGGYNRWTCTKSCFPFFRSFILQNRALRRWVLEEARKEDPSLEDFERSLEYLTDIVPGGRVTVVPKNNEKARPINVEPFGNSIVQYAIGRSLMRVLGRLGNDLFTGQDLHRQRISEDGISTIDLSDASDSISLDLVRFLLPPSVFELLDDTRSKALEFDGYYFRPNKISCQGNGFTFPLMTLILLAACKACGDDEASVYGDDIIIKDEYADDLVSLIESLGFIVNKEKSFIRSHFRESCGGFYCGGYITCFDIKYVTHPLELFSTLNKIYLITQSPYSDDRFKELWVDLLSLIPDGMKGPIPSDKQNNLSLYVWTEGHKNRANAASWLEQRFQRLAGSIFSVISFRPTFTDGEKLNPRKHNLVQTMLRLRAGQPVNRNLRGVAAWEPTSLYGDESGVFIDNRGYRYLRSKERKYLSEIFECKPNREIWDCYTASASFERFQGLVTPRNYLKER